ncbi:MAG: pyridoxal-phosphate-dependent aminotransferase family protein [Candidatus Eiseniibacteriota bacterium]
MKTRLFTPGPVEVPPRILAALARPAIHHRTEAFRKILADTTKSLIDLIGTDGVVVTLSASGSGGMEAALVNLVGPGTRPLVVEAGKFGERWTKILKAYGVEPEVLSFDWGRVADPSAVAARLAARSSGDRAPAVFFTHSETSTGVLHDAAAIARAAREHGALAVADVVTSLGVHDLRMDAMGIDAAVAGSQKGLMLPPGLAFVALGKRALEQLEGSRLPRFYMDLRKAAQTALEGDTPFTPPTALVVGLAESLLLIREEGREAVVARHAANAGATRAAAVALGLPLFAERPSNAVTALHAPEGLDAGRIVKGLREHHGIVIANGQDRLKGISFRVGHMGAYDATDMLGLVGALEDVLIRLGQPIEPGKGLAAAQRAYASGPSGAGVAAPAGTPAAAGRGA